MLNPSVEWRTRLEDRKHVKARRALDRCLCEDESELVLEIPEDAPALDLEDHGVGAAPVEAEDCRQQVARAVMSWPGRRGAHRGDCAGYAWGRLARDRVTK